MKKDILRVFMTNVIKVSTVLVATFFIPAVLSVEQYASYKLFALISSYIGLLHFGYCDGIFIEYGGCYLREISQSKLADEQKTIFIFEALISLIIIMSGIIFRNTIIFIAGLNVLPSILIIYYAMLYQSMAEFKLYASIYNGMSVLTLISNAALIFIVHEDNGLLFAIVTVIVNFITVIYTAIYFNQKYVKCTGKTEASILIKYMKKGILLTIGNVAYILFSSIDKWFVKGLLGMEEFAYYSFAVQLLSAMNMFINPVGLTLYSYLSRQREEKFEYNVKIILMVLLYFMLIGVFAIKIIINYFLPKYTNSISLIVILFLAQVFLLLNTTIYVNLFKTYRMQRQYFINLIIAIVLSVVLNAVFFLIGEGTSGDITIATLISMILWEILNLRYFKYLKFNLKHIFFVVSMTIIYVLANICMSDIWGFVLYGVSWIVCLNIFARDVSVQFVHWIKKGFDSLKKKF